MKIETQNFCKKLKIIESQLGDSSEISKLHAVKEKVTNRPHGGANEMSVEKRGDVDLWCRSLGCYSLEGETCRVWAIYTADANNIYWLDVESDPCKEDLVI